MAATRGVERALARKREKYEDEVQRLLDATRRVMRGHGTVDPTVNEILAEAGLSTTAFYRHFPTKDDLLLTISLQASATARSYVEHRMAGVADAAARVAAWIEAMLDLLGTEGNLATNRAFLLSHLRLVERFAEEIDAANEPLVALLADAIAEARADAGLPPVDARGEARLVHHQVFAVLLDRAARNRTTDAALDAALVDHTRRAVLGPP